MYIYRIIYSLLDRYFIELRVATSPNYQYQLPAAGRPLSRVYIYYRDAINFFFGKDRRTTELIRELIGERIAYSLRANPRDVKWKKKNEKEKEIHASIKTRHYITLKASCGAILRIEARLSRARARVRAGMRIHNTNRSIRLHA